MESFLNKVLQHKLAEIHAKKENRPLASFKDKVEKADGSFFTSISSKRLSIIAELKPRSPVLGAMIGNQSIDERIEIYSRRAQAISVLCDQKFFDGSIDLLNEVSQKATRPTLCKDFIIDPYQIHEARMAGAGAVLLICKMLDMEKLSQLFQLSEELAMTPVVEVQNETEMSMAKKVNARAILINSRNLDTLQIDLNTIRELSPTAPQNATVIAASGIETAADLQSLLPYASCFLIGSAFMKSTDLEAKFLEFYQADRLYRFNLTLNPNTLTHRESSPSTLASDAASNALSNPSSNPTLGPGSNPTLDSGSNPESKPTQNLILKQVTDLASSPVMRLAINPDQEQFAAIEHKPVKICGICNLYDARKATDEGARFLGLIMAESPRAVSLETAKQISRELSGQVSLVGVFKDQSLDFICQATKEIGFDLLQLHGKESPSFARELSEQTHCPIIKAIELDPSQPDFLSACNPSPADYDSSVGIFLFDRAKTQSGDERWLEKVKSKFGAELQSWRPFLFAGGLNEQNIGSALALNPDGLDLASGIEKSPGVKDHKKLEDLFANLKGSIKC